MKTEDSTYTADLGARAENARNLSGDKELVSSRDLVGLFGADDLRTAVTACWWMGRSRTASMVYCSVWIRHPDGRWWSGYGTAGGFGYCKQSAAFDEALDSAGVTLRHGPGNDGREGKPASVHGTGMTAVDHAINAIGDALGMSATRVIVS